MDINTLRGIATVLALIAFLGVVWWAYSGRQKSRFSDAANSLFSDEEERRHRQSLEEMKK